MKKITIFVITLLCLAAITVQAQVSLDNANTPEAILEQCPEYPTAPLLYDENNPSMYINAELWDYYSDRLEAVKSKLSVLVRNQGTQQIKNSADASLRKQFGKSADELVNMSNANYNVIADKMVSQKLSQVGMENMNIADLEKLADKSDEEIMKLMMGKSSGGLTTEELKAMENMTTKQREEYMSQGDRMERAKHTAATMSNGMGKQSKIADNAWKAEDIRLKIVDIDTLIQQDIRVVRNSIAKIRSKYAIRIEQTQKQIQSVTNDIAIDMAPIRKIENERAMELHPMSRNLVSRIKAHIKKELTLANSLDKLVGNGSINACIIVTKYLELLDFMKDGVTKD